MGWEVFRPRVPLVSQVLPHSASLPRRIAGLVGGKAHAWDEPALCMATGAEVPPQAQETRQEKTKRQGMGAVKDSQDRTLTLGTVKLGFFDCEETRVSKRVRGGERVMQR